MAIGAPWLWTSIPTDPDFDNPEWTRTALERSKPEPLDITLIGTPWRMNLAVYRHISRISSLSLEYIDAKELDDMAYMLSVIGDDAKELVDLRILGCEYENKLFKLPPTCFQGATLEYLDLQWIDIDWRMPLLSPHLSHLSLQFISSTSTPSWDNLFDVLACMPGLVTLVLTQVFPVTPLRNPLKRVHLPCLIRLSVAAKYAFQAESFFAHVTFPPLHSVKISCKRNNPRNNNYSAVLGSIAHRFPPTSYGRFNQLGIRSNTCATENFWGNYFTCRTAPNDTDPGGGIDIVLCPTVDVSAERITTDVLIHFNFHHHLTSLSIGSEDGRIPFLPEESLRNIFGSMPNLETISVAGVNALCLVEALTIPVGHPSGAPVSFPALQEVTLVGLDMERNKEHRDELEDILMARYEYGAEICTLYLCQCFNISAAVVERFELIVTDFSWSDDDMFAMLAAMKREERVIHS